MEMPIDEVTDLTIAVLRSIGYSGEDAVTVADHLVDCELRGLGYGGLARRLTLQERQDKYRSRPGGRPELFHDTPISATLDGKDVVGYLVALEATNLAIAKAKEHGVGVVGAANTWCSGMSSYYLERVTSQNLVAIAIASGGPLVAPHGGNEAKLGTNPVAIGFPTEGDPIIWDIGTSAIMLAQATLASRTGDQIEPAVAFAADGSPTTDPVAALSGSFAAWGGHKGSGLAVMTQLMGFLAGATVEPGYLQDHAYLIVVIDPAILGDVDELLSRATQFAASLRSSRAIDTSNPVRLPFDGSLARRAAAVERGVVSVDDVVVQRARALVAERSSHSAV